MIYRFRFFGAFQISADGFPILPELQRARKMPLLLEYLVLKGGAPATSEELISVLWPDEEQSSSPDTALRTLVHRCRRLMAEAGFPELSAALQSGRGQYAWTPRDPWSSDVGEFEALSAQRRSAGDPAAKRELSVRLVEVYGGPLYRRSAESYWFQSKAVSFQDEYRVAVLELIEAYRRRNDQAAVIRLCQNAVNMELIDERVFAELIKALLAVGNAREALDQYHIACNALQQELGVKSSARLDEVYGMILRAERGPENDISNVCSALAERLRPEGAFLCDYETFRSIYRLQCRVAARYDHGTWLGLFSMQGPAGESEEGKKGMNEAMFLLEEILQTHLRRSDVLARYSFTQIVTQLPAVKQESVEMVLGRVQKEFERRSPAGSPYTVTYHAAPLAPNG